MARKAAEKWPHQPSVSKKVNGLEHCNAAGSQENQQLLSEAPRESLHAPQAHSASELRLPWAGDFH